jgi:hypothetical protein
MNPEEAAERLFSYGTLQVETVQLATFGRTLSGEPDVLPGFRRARIPVRGPGGATTGYYLNAQFTGRDTDAVEGTLFAVTGDELARADRYEATADYKRIRVRLKSGAWAWVYISAAPDG